MSEAHAEDGHGHLYLSRRSSPYRSLCERFMTLRGGAQLQRVVHLSKLGCERWCVTVHARSGLVLRTFPKMALTHWAIVPITKNRELEGLRP